MKLAFRSGAFLVTFSLFSLNSCGKKEETPAAPAKNDSAPAADSTPASPAKESTAPAPAVPQMKEPSASTKSSTGEERDFFGTVGGQPVVASLTIGANTGGTSEVKGWYYPESRGSNSKLTLSGTLKDNVLSLDQITEGKVTATFELRSENANGKTYMGNCMVLGRALPTKLTAR